MGVQYPKRRNRLAIAISILVVQEMFQMVRGKHCLHYRNETFLAKERSDGPNSFLMCTVSMKTELAFELETGKSVSAIPNGCRLGKPRGWTGVLLQLWTVKQTRDATTSEQSQCQARGLGSSSSPWHQPTLPPCPPAQQNCEAACTAAGQKVFYR